MRVLALPRRSRFSAGQHRPFTRRRHHVTARARKPGRYTASFSEQGQYQPGSRRQVLRNVLGITSPAKMHIAERRQFVRAARSSFAACGEDQKFTAFDICEFHRAWLGNIYSWAGLYRQVNLSKGGFMFAAADRVPDLMEQLECGPLSTYTPCRIANDAELARALAETHAELVLIHPFREGNGRVARHFANLMVWQAGRFPLDFAPIAAERKVAYFASIQAALAGDYAHLQRLFAELIALSASRVRSR